MTTVEFAELKGCTVQYARRFFKNNEAVIIKTSAENNRPQSFLPISALPEDIKTVYYSRQQGGTAQPVTKKPETQPLPKAKPKRERREFGSFSADDREVIAFWSETLREWQSRRREYDSLAEGDMVFVAELKRLKREFLTKHNISVSRDILYRKYRFFKDGDLEGLTECRGGSGKGKNAIPEELSKVFNDLYLCDQELPVSDCYKLTVEWARENRPELVDTMPSERTFRRHINDIPEAVVKYFRKGEKVCIDECMPYIIRLYDDIEANDVWVADNHTFDFMTRTNDGQRLHRMYITGILDAKTGALVGWNITENPCSQSTVLALRHAIMRCGIPQYLYVDNGTEFLTHDIGGKGHRARKSQKDMPHPPTILDRLGIKMVNALVCNGRAKPIERMFLTLKNTISRLFKTFTGGNVTERPESLKWQLKHGIVPYDRQMIEKMDILLEGYNGSPYGGYEKQFKGMSRAEAWCRSVKNRTVTYCDELTLNLLLMRNTRYQTVSENGVWVNYSGEKLWYNTGDNWKYVGTDVYVRYDPADWESVKVYDKTDTYIGDWQIDRNVFVDYITVNTEDIADIQRLRSRQLRAVREMGSELRGDMRIDALALAAAEAQRKTASVTLTLPENRRKLEYKENYALPKAAGDDDMDLSYMLKNIESRKEAHNKEGQI